MPVFYLFEKETKQEYVYSDSILLMTPEPDFSMPFNVNAVTHALFGIIFCNTVFAIYNTNDDTKEAEEKKECVKEKTE